MKGNVGSLLTSCWTQRMIRPSTVNLPIVNGWPVDGIQQLGTKIPWMTVSHQHQPLIHELLELGHDRNEWVRLTLSSTFVNLSRKLTFRWIERKVIRKGTEWSVSVPAGSPPAVVTTHPIRDSEQLSLSPAGEEWTNGWMTITPHSRNRRVVIH